jgi:hypothetical protein
MLARVRVLEVFCAAGRVMLKLEMLQGELRAGIQLSSTSGHKIEVVGVAFSPADAWQAGIRLASVSVLSGECPEAGVMLQEVTGNEP